MKWMKILLITILCLLAMRIALPHVLLHYAEYRINKIPEYKVEIADLDVHLYRGSYTLKKIKLYKMTKNIPVPFFSADAVDLSVEWRALLHGSFVGKITAIHPTINFVSDPKNQNEQLTIDKEWEHAVKALFPLNFNKITLQDGTLSFRSFKGNPPFNLFLKNIDLEIVNMQNVQRSEQLLTSSFNAKAKTMDGGDVSLDGKFDSFSKQPTFKLEAAIRSMEINKANAFLQHFTHVDVKQGHFSLFVEAAAANGKINGYAKPIIKDLQVLNPEKDHNPVEFLYKGALDLVAKIVTNHEKKTIATRININGNLDDPNTSTLSIVSNLLRHAFIQALLPQIDHTISMQDITYGAQKVNMHSAKK